MYPNTECPHDCYKPGDCDGSCTHCEPEWTALGGYVDPPPAPEGFVTEVKREPHMGIVTDYRYVRAVVAGQQRGAPSANPADAFRNTFAILHNLETGDLPFMDAEQRLAFFRDPVLTVLKLDDARLDALYALVQSRQPERYREAG